VPAAAEPVIEPKPDALEAIPAREPELPAEDGMSRALSTSRVFEYPADYRALLRWAGDRSEAPAAARALGALVFSKELACLLAAP